MFILLQTYLTFQRETLKVAQFLWQMLDRMLYTSRYCHIKGRMANE